MPWMTGTCAGVAAPRAFEVDDVQTLGTGRFETPRHRYRVVVIDGDFVILALVEADDFSVEQVDRRESTP